MVELPLYLLKEAQRSLRGAWLSGHCVYHYLRTWTFKNPERESCGRKGKKGSKGVTDNVSEALTWTRPPTCAVKSQWKSIPWVTTHELHRVKTFSLGHHSHRLHRADMPIDSLSWRHVHVGLAWELMHPISTENRGIQVSIEIVASQSPLSIEAAKSPLRTEDLPHERINTRSLCHESHDQPWCWLQNPEMSLSG